MIFYFSGVGNSRWVANRIAEELGDRLVFIPDAMLSGEPFQLADDEAVGFIFPCYGWGVPTFIERFIEQVQMASPSYLYMITTCGDDTGKTGEIFCEDVARRGWTCQAAWAVQMPESYICLPGFDVDSPKKETRKYAYAQQRVNYIAEAIRRRETGVMDTIPGPLKWAKSHIVRPFFNRFLISDKPFKALDACTGCGKCEKVCPKHNIRLTDERRPEWHHDCVLCLRCYHACPVHAIHWGIMTLRKGQYLCKLRK